MDIRNISVPWFYVCRSTVSSTPYISSRVKISKHFYWDGCFSMHIKRCRNVPVQPVCQSVLWNVCISSMSNCLYSIIAMHCVILQHTTWCCSMCFGCTTDHWNLGSSDIVSHRLLKWVACSSIALPAPQSLSPFGLTVWILKPTILTRSPIRHCSHQFWVPKMLIVESQTTITDLHGLHTMAAIVIVH